MVQKFRADEYLEILSSNLLIQIELIFLSFYPIIGLKILRQFFCQRRDLLLLHTVTLVATKEITLTNTLTFQLQRNTEHQQFNKYVNGMLDALNFQ